MTVTTVDTAMLTQALQRKAVLEAIISEPDWYMYTTDDLEAELDRILDFLTACNQLTGFDGE